jgi:hypothetical protein
MGLSTVFLDKPGLHTSIVLNDKLGGKVRQCRELAGCFRLLCP